LLFGIPNVEVVAPSIMHDPGTLLLISIERGVPVLLVENKLDYGRALIESGENPRGITVGNSGGLFPVAHAAITGADRAEAAIISYGGATSFALEAQMELFMEDEMAIEVISPSRIDPILPEDIRAALGDCDNVLVAEEGIGDFGWGEHVAIVLRESGYTGRIRRVGAVNAVIGASSRYEEQTLLTTKRIKAEIHELIAG
jgi:acetoin:2,6-dichlorophenolindophenol oxidoreductase subunit beta